jgi:uncharacterized protein (TIGR03435 family)
MTNRTLTLLALLTTPALAQSPAPAPPPAAAAPTFQLADVHPSAHTTNPNFTGGSLRGDRYLLHNATMLNLIALAYGVDNDHVLAGPSWLDLDRFDVTAAAPRTTSQDDLKLMLQALLAERFHLVLHKDTKPVPAFVLTVAPGGPKMKPARSSESSSCDPTPNAPTAAPGTPSFNYITCHNVTADQIADNLHGMANGYLTNPVVNATGLKGAFDFDIHWTSRGNLTADGISIFDAVQKQLGLKLDAGTAPSPVLVVDGVDEKPTPNAPSLDKALPPLPPQEFDVAVITTSKPGASFNGRITGDQVNATGMTLRFLIDYAFDLNSNVPDLIANAPKWIDDDHWDVLAKAAPEAQAIGPDGQPQVDPDLLPHMAQTLLAQRFNMKYHFEDRPIEALTLVAVNPKMKKADPLGRTGCKEGPGPDGKDPRIANPILGRLLYCRNMTMAQLADQLPNLAGGYVFTPVLDSTGLKDAYDFTLNFSSANQLRNLPPPPPSANPNDPSSISDPSGGLSLSDAMAKQLGVKLVKEKRPSPVLVIDHIEEHPTEN